MLTCRGAQRHFPRSYAAVNCTAAPILGRWPWRRRNACEHRTPQQGKVGGASGWHLGDLFYCLNIRNNLAANWARK